MRLWTQDIGSQARFGHSASQDCISARNLSAMDLDGRRRENLDGCADPPHHSALLLTLLAVLIARAPTARQQRDTAPFVVSKDIPRYHALGAWRLPLTADGGAQGLFLHARCLFEDEMSTGIALASQVQPACRCLYHTRVPAECRGPLPPPYHQTRDTISHSNMKPVASAAALLGLVSAVLSQAETPGPSPTESIGCEPHGDHWYVPSSRVATSIPRHTY